MSERKASDNANDPKLEGNEADGITASINLFTRVSGIGPAKAKGLVDMGFRSLDDLRKKTDKLSPHQKIGLIYFDDFEKKIPREEVQRIETFLNDSLPLLEPGYKVTMCGSYRRGKAESGNIDVLITHESYTSSDSDKKKGSNMLESVVEYLEEKELIVDRISMGDLEFKGVCRNPEGVNEVFRRLNIRLSAKDHYYCALLHLTGSDSFNKRMRKHAKKNNFKLNQNTLQRHGMLHSSESNLILAETIESEEDIFEKLGLPYKKPEERNS